MDILDIITHHKRKEVALRKEIISLKNLEQGAFFDKETISLKKAILSAKNAGIIAEFKRKSPSKGYIHENADALQITKGYQTAGASAVSILTDSEFFGGAIADLVSSREVLSIPILRKEFIIDEYQIVEAKAIGADAILLIAACLDASLVKNLAKCAKSLGLEVLLEVHQADELAWSLNEYVDLVGVNNRNLRTFEVNIQTSLELAALIPSDFVKISESGLSENTAVHTLIRAGFRGFLVGESLMRTPNPEEALRHFRERVMGDID
jgi:indole-3-glycerol phosphate synthase